MQEEFYKKTNIQKARTQITKTYLNKNKELQEDLNAILSQTKKLFLENNNWIHESTSVPLKYIKESEEAQTLRVLSRDDYKTIMRRHRAKYASKSLDELIQSQSIPANIQEINHLVVAKRKLDVYKNDKYASQQNDQDAKNTMQYWRKELFLPIEYAQEEFDLSFSEIMNRLRDKINDFEFFGLSTRNIFKAEQHKLYSKEFSQKIHESLQKIKDLVPYTKEIDELNKEAKIVDRHHLVLQARFGHFFSDKEFAYIYSWAVKNMKETVEVKQTLQELEELVEKEKILEAKEQYKKLTSTHRNYMWNAKVYDGEFEEGAFCARWSFFKNQAEKFQARKKQYRLYCRSSSVCECSYEIYSSDNRAY
jgi:hypothetical protein